MFDVRLTGADQLRDDLKALDRQAADLRPVWDEFQSGTWRPRQLAHFGTLPRLAKSTRARKRVHKDEPLVLTGALRSATYVGSPVKDTPSMAAFGIAKGKPVRKLAILHKSSARLKHRDAVPKLERRERAVFKKLLRAHLNKAWDQ